MALVVLFIVNVEEPPVPAIDDGLKPPLVMPAGKPDSLPTLRPTAPIEPLTGVMVTLKVVDRPGTTGLDEGLTAIEKSALGGSTVIVRGETPSAPLPPRKASLPDLVRLLPRSRRRGLEGVGATPQPTIWNEEGIHVSQSRHSHWLYRPRA